MNSVFVIALLGFIIVSTVMILIILVQRPSGGGLAGAFGGAGATSSESVFGGRVGDVLTNVTIGAFVAYLALAITLTLVKAGPQPIAATPAITAPGLPGDAPTTGMAPDGSTLTPEQLANLRAQVQRQLDAGEEVPQQLLNMAGMSGAGSTPPGSFDPSGSLDLSDPGVTEDDLAAPAGGGGTP
ncbi:MAG: preprotein translocase subunit SecG [Phycisphaerales bacterium]|nr:preprotein translocase subunit SecG [Phycisphaerales bacterium]